MGEIKSVKVDNWGVFFLQKLQNFFNKTDYCDLTLQFRDNSQLKVHRLVLSACTDYFNVLEQTCEVIDDAIIMPNELQADVVVPIVNFMYTGTLEFELRMYNRLLRTAREMNMTVLLKLLEAHRRTMELHPQKTQGTASPKLRRRAVQTNSGNNTQLKNVANSPSGPNVRLPTAPSSAVTVQRRILPASTNTNRMTQNASANSVSTMARQTTTAATNVNTVTYTRIKQENAETNTNTASSVGYGGKSSLQQSPTGPSSTFEQLRKSYNNNKRPATATFISPPAKKPNLEDVKEFAEQQRMRKQIAAEYGDTDGDYDGALMDDDIHNDDDDDDISGNQSSFQPNNTASHTHASSSSAISTSKIAASAASTTTSTADKSSAVDPPGTTTITVKHEGPDKPPTIVVKDSSNSKMNHAKIISEVLRQYPHLIKSNKNIKLKIMPNTNLTSGTSTSTTSNNTSTNQKIIVKKDNALSSNAVESSNAQQHQLTRVQHHSSEPAVVKVSPTTTAGRGAATSIASTTISSTSAGTSTISPVQQKQQQQQRNVSTNNAQQNVKVDGTSATIKVTSATTATSTATTSGQQTQKRRIDSKTMHALIALGAENTTGPWLCLRCGRNGHPISIPSYRGFRRHLINTHKETIDPDLCEYCGWRSSGKRELHFHMQLEHKVKTSLYIFPECQLCQQMCIDSDALNQHLIDSHPDENKQQCIYCNKIFPEEVQLYIHIKTYHKKQALDDGIIDYSDDEAEKQQEQQNLYQELMGEFISTNDRDGFKVEEDKVKILSDISLPSTSSIVNQEVSTTSKATSKTTTATTKSLAASTAAASSTSTKTIESAATYLHHVDTETKFVTADGSEVILTDEQRKEILSQLNQEHDAGGVVMVLSEQQSEQLGAISHDDTSQATTETNEEPMEHDDSHIYDEMRSLSQRAIRTTLSTAGAASAAATTKAPMDVDEDDDEEDEDEKDEDENDDEEEQEDESHEMHEHDEEEHANNEAKGTEEGHHRLHKNNTPIDENKESLDNLEWAENVISQHELADTAKTTSPNNKEPMDIENNKSNNNNNSEKAGSDQSFSNKKPKDVVSLHHPDEISKKLKELTGDWSDDDIEEDMSADEILMDTGKKSDTLMNTKKEEKSPSPLTETTTTTIKTEKIKTKTIKSAEDSNVKISERFAEMDTEMLELVGVKADLKMKDNQSVKTAKDDKMEETSCETENNKIENYDKLNDNDSDDYDNNDLDDDNQNDDDDDHDDGDGDDDEDEDDIDLALKSLHKGIEPESSSPTKDHNISDELESLHVKLTKEITSNAEHHNERKDNNNDNDNDNANDTVNNDNDEDNDPNLDNDDGGAIKEKNTIEMGKQIISPKVTETTQKNNDLIEMLINDAEVCSVDTPTIKATVVNDIVATTTATTTITKANVSTTLLKSSSIGLIKAKKDEHASETEIEAEIETETESELNTSDPTQTEVNIEEEEEEFVPVKEEVKVVTPLLSATDNKTKSVECMEKDKNTLIKSGDGEGRVDSNIPMPSSTATTEDRVKSLMSEWGEDDDDDVNDDDAIDNDDDDETENL